MSLDSVGLFAKQSYMKVENGPKIDTTEANIKNASLFHKSFEVHFNKFVNMSPNQILQEIKKFKEKTLPENFPFTKNTEPATGIAGKLFSNIKNSISNYEQTGREFLIGEASTLDLAAAATEAKNHLEATVKIRDKLTDALDKVLNMNI